MKPIRTPLLAAGIFLTGIAGQAPAAEQPKAQTADAPKPAATSEADPIGAGMAAAQRSLTLGDGSDAAAAQEQVIADLDALLDAASSEGASSTAATMQSSAGDQAGDQAGEPKPASDGVTAEPSETQQKNRAQQEANQDDPGPSQKPAASAAEDSEKTPQAPAEERPLPFPARFDRADGAWGHLPPRLRDQLRNAASDRFLPSYDALMRGYYESLSKVPLRPSAQSRPVTPAPEPPR